MSGSQWQQPDSLIVAICLVPRWKCDHVTYRLGTFMADNKEEDDNEFPRRLALQDVEDALRELAANIVRVVRGAGMAPRIGSQAHSLIEAMVAYQKVVGHWPVSEEISAALDVSDPDESLDRMDDDALEYASARQAIVRGALQIAASKLVGQRTQEAAGESELFDGIKRLEKVREERRQKWAAASSLKTPPRDTKRR